MKLTEKNLKLEGAYEKMDFVFIAFHGIRMFNGHGREQGYYPSIFGRSSAYRFSGFSEK